MKVERTIELPAEPQAVYELVMDPRRLEDWVTIHAGLKDAPNWELRKGSELTQCLKLAGRKFKVVYDLEPANGNGTRFCYSNESSMRGGPLGRLASRALKGTSERESERSLKRLKALLTG